MWTFVWRWMAIHMIWLIRRRSGFVKIRYAFNELLAHKFQRLFSYVWNHKKNVCFFSCFIIGNACYDGILQGIKHYKILCCWNWLHLCFFSQPFVRNPYFTHVKSFFNNDFFLTFVQHEVFLFVELFGY